MSKAVGAKETLKGVWTIPFVLPPSSLDFFSSDLTEAARLTDTYMKFLPYWRSA